MNYFFKVLSKYAIFNGRARRSEYWYFALISTIITVILMMIGNAIKFPLLNSIYSFAVMLPSIAVGVRRMHDIDKSGWFFLIPIYNIFLLFRKGTIGENKYGEDPKGGVAFGADDYEKPLEISPDI